MNKKHLENIVEEVMKDLKEMYIRNPRNPARNKARYEAFMAKIPMDRSLTKQSAALAAASLGQDMYANKRVASLRKEEENRPFDFYDFNQKGRNEMTTKIYAFADDLARKAERSGEVRQQASSDRRDRKNIEYDNFPYSPADFDF